MPCGCLELYFMSCGLLLPSELQWHLELRGREVLGGDRFFLHFMPGWPVPELGFSEQLQSVPCGEDPSRGDSQMCSLLL